MTLDDSGDGSLAPRTLSDGSGVSDSWPELASNTRGDLAVAWSQGGTIRVRLRPAGAAWGPEITVSDADARWPVIGLDDAGRVTVGWRQVTGAGTSLHTSTGPITSTSRAAWTAPDQLIAPQHMARLGSIAVGPEGHVVAAAVSQRVPEDTEILSTWHRSPGGSWSPSLLGTGNANTELVVDRVGLATLAWTSNGVSRVSTAAPGQPWSTRDLGTAWIQDLVIDQDTGNVVMTYLVGPSYTRVVTHREPGGAWRELSSSPGASGLLLMRLGVNGTDVVLATAKLVGSDMVIETAAWDETAPVIRSLTLPTGPVGQPLSFSASVEEWLPYRVEWDFGDGASATGASAQHTYTVPGTYRASVRVVDAVGLVAVRTVDVTVTVPPLTGPGPAPVPPAPIGAAPAPAGAPRILGLDLTRKKIRTSRAPRRTRLVVTTDSAASVRVVLRRRGSRKVVARLARSVPAGEARLTISTRMGKARLRAGRYVITAVARNDRGVSTPVRVTLRVRR
ncbi:PKD domain-containing protein [Nocardioides seonyuensis]|uniref:PKD domain-containing protein n=2 Tax=Nocardioides seonyuensis TaxID=2518371 RepID=A0A4P7IJK7_9ACTN|nr:PKD domain-containing protein [Nocardioides seonyuensis]